MNKKIIVITIIIGIVLFFAIAFENRYNLFSLMFYSVTIEEKSELCKTINREWDEAHNTCDYVEDVQCLAMGGKPIECKSRKWRCPQDNQDCDLPAMCIPTCSFPNP